MLRRYLFRLYPTPAQADTLHQQCRMVADLWNALLQRYEDIKRRTEQRQVWFDAAGKRHQGLTSHSATWVSVRYAHGETVVIVPGKNGRPKPFTAYDMQNEVTALVNADPEWRALSVWTGHRTAQLLDRAIQAFYRRASAGAGAQAGYPRYKRRAAHNSIPHRCLSGCKLSKSPRHRLSWELRLKGVAGPIHARGLIPGGAGVNRERMTGAVEKWTDADVIWRDGKWWLSVATEIAPRRHPPRHEQGISVRFDLLDDFARVNGIAETPAGLLAAQLIDERLDELKSERDQRWPRGRRLADQERAELAGMKARITRLAARAARIRRNALHVWTARLVAGGGDLTIIAPPIVELTKTPRGDAKEWGASVALVSELNRRARSMAAGMAIQMLRYKAEEAGIRCDVVSDSAPKIAVGAELVRTAKRVRRIGRELKRSMAA